MNNHNRSAVFRLVLAAMFLAIGLVLPFFTGQLKQIGNMLLPMHLPVMLCGLICGWHYGLLIGGITPLLRALLFGMPLFFPNAVAMAFELATYGAVIGLLFQCFRRQGVRALYCSLLSSMLAGRLVWGIVMMLLLGLSGSHFTLLAFWTSAFLNAIPGIAVQLVLIPTVMVLLDRAHLLPFRRK